MSNSDQGSALVVALWGIVIIGMLAMISVKAFRLAELETNANVAVAQTQLVADGMVMLAAARLQSGEWQTNSVHNSRPISCRAFDGYQVLLLIEDEVGKVDLNSASYETFVKLLVGLGVQQSEASNISKTMIAFSTAAQSQSAFDVERQDYASQGLPDGPKHAPFETIFELQTVKGINSELFEALLPYVTVHSHRPTPNAAYATDRLRSVLDLSSSKLTSSVPYKEPITGHQITVRIELTSYTGIKARREAILEFHSPDKLPRILEWRRGRTLPEIGEQEKVISAQSGVPC